MASRTLNEEVKEMPWETRTVEETRETFVKRVQAKEKSISALCREYGISRPTGYKWLKRSENGEGMANRSRRPFRTPNRIEEAVESRIVEMRRREPAIGAVKTRRMLTDAGMTAVPSASTINEIFRRNGLITAEASEKATPYKRFEHKEPNIMLQADFKGHFAMRNGKRCHPLSIIDDHSRFCLCADALPNTTLETVKPSFERTFQTFGLPHILLCDNGVPWGSSQSGALTAFEVWLMELGVQTIHIRAGHPQTQGKVERFNGSYKQERLNFYVPEDLEDAMRSREEYRAFYNNVRPHHALGLDVPCRHYTSSPREMPQRILPWEYDGGSEVRTVKSTGYLTFQGRGWYLSEGLAHKQVALIPSGQDGVWNVVYRQFRIAQLDLHELVIRSKKIIRFDP